MSTAATTVTNNLGGIFSSVSTFISVFCGGAGTSEALVLRQYDDEYFDNKTSAFDNAREENSITNLSCQKRLQQQQRLPLLLRHQNRLRRE